MFYIGIAIAYVIVIHLIVTGQNERARLAKLAEQPQKKNNNKVEVSYHRSETSQITDGKPPIFTYIPPDEVPKIEQKKGRVSNEFWKSHLANKILKDRE